MYQRMRCQLVLLLNIMIPLIISAGDVMYEMSGGGGKVLMCYVVFWSVQRDMEGQFSMDLIDPHLCTHIIYSSNKIKANSQQIIPTDPSADFIPGNGNFDKLLKLKDENPGLKILISIGGKYETPLLLSQMVQSQQNRTSFINGALAFLRSNGFDGLDFDWEYPTRFGGKDEDRDNFCTLLEELRESFDQRAYILTARLNAMRYIVDTAYDVKRISKAVHFINVKSSDYHGQWDRKTAVHSPLNSKDEFNVKFSLQYLIKKGADPSKMLLGIKTDGSALLMNSPASSAGHGNYLGVTANDVFAATLTDSPGVFGYIDYCWEKFKLKEPWMEFWHTESSTPYAVLGNKFISFENEESIKAKLKLVEEKQLGGVNLFSLDTDDFRGFCNQHLYPLTKLVRDLIVASPPPLLHNSSLQTYSLP